MPSQATRNLKLPLFCFASNISLCYNFSSSSVSISSARLQAAGFFGVFEDFGGRKPGIQLVLFGFQFGDLYFSR